MSLTKKILNVLIENEQLNELNLNTDNYGEIKPPEKFNPLPQETLDKIKFENNDKIKIGRNFVILDDQDVGIFRIKSIGDIIVDPDEYFDTIDGKQKKVFHNSIFFSGGFTVYKRGQGIGKAIIKKIFKDNPSIENIFLYALDKQNAVKFWQKLGGVILFKEEGLNYIQLNRNNIK